MATLFKYGMWAVCRLEQPRELGADKLPPCAACNTPFGVKKPAAPPAGDPVISRGINRWDVHYLNPDSLSESDLRLFFSLFGALDVPFCESCTCLLESLLTPQGFEGSWSQSR